MDIQRTGLFAVLGILTYSLFLQWNNFTDQQTPTVSDTTPTLGSQTNKSFNEVPSSPSTLSPKADNPPAQLELTDENNIITINTPIISITVSLEGGDITQVLLKDYPISLKAPDQPIALLDSRSRIYIAQTGLVGPDGPDSFESGRPTYSAIQSTFDIDKPSTVSIKTTTNSGLTIDKIFTVHPERYDIGVSHTITNNSSSIKTVTPFVQLKRDNSLDPSIQNSMGMQAFLGFALPIVDDRYRKVSFSDFTNESDARELNIELKEKGIPGGYLALLQHYFTTAWVPDSKIQHLYTFRSNSKDQFIGSIISPNISINPSATHTTSATLYDEKKNQKVLEKLSPGLELVVDYGWLWFIAQPLFWLLKFIQTYVVNWGFAIILVTVLVKGAFFQLSAAAYKSMAKMRKFTPEITRLREIHGDDRQRMSKEMMDLYKREKINPLGGCLPIIVQMPVFIALYWVLLESVELRQAPFILWITDLSAKDPYFILPLLMGVSMFIQTSLNPTPPDPMQAKIMKYMPVAFTFFFLWFPAGLVLYWVVNNVLSIAQQWVITKSIEKSG